MMALFHQYIILQLSLIIFKLAVNKWEETEPGKEAPDSFEKNPDNGITQDRDSWNDTKNRQVQPSPNFIGFMTQDKHSLNLYSCNALCQVSAYYIV